MFITSYKYIIKIDLMMNLMIFILYHEYMQFFFYILGQS
jgi:hypothetical protein